MAIKYYRMTKWQNTLADCRGWFSHMVDKNIGCAIVKQLEKPKRYAVFVNGTEVGDAIKYENREEIDDKYVICKKHNFNQGGVI